MGSIRTGNARHRVQIFLERRRGAHPLPRSGSPDAKHLPRPQASQDATNGSGYPPRPKAAVFPVVAFKIGYPESVIDFRLCNEVFRAIKNRNVTVRTSLDISEPNCTDGIFRSDGLSPLAYRGCLCDGQLPDHPHVFKPEKESKGLTLLL